MRGRAIQGPAAYVIGAVCTALGGMLVLLIATGIAAKVWLEHLDLWPGSSPRPTQRAETVEQKYERASEVFRVTPEAGDNAAALSRADPSRDAAIQRFFEVLAKRVRRQQSDDLAKLFDPAMMLGAAESGGGRLKWSRADRKAFERGLSQGIGQALMNSRTLVGWDRVEVKRVESLSDDEAIVYVRHWDESQFPVKMRWWLSKRNGKWRFYDYEDLGGSVRASVGVSVTIAGLGRNAQLPAWVPAVRSMTWAFQELVAADLDAAERSLTAASKAKLPKQFEAMREMAWGCLRTSQERYDEALPRLDRALSLHPDLPVVHLLRAVSLNGLGDHDAARVAAQTYLDQLGDDATGLVELGRALQGLGRDDEALRAFERAIADNPNDGDALFELGLALPAERKGEIADHFRAMRAPAEWYDPIASLFVDWGDEAALRTLNDAYREINRNDVWLVYYDAVVTYWSGDYAAASDTLEAALRDLDDAVLHESFEAFYIQVMLDAGRPIRAYRRVTDHHVAFITIGLELVEWAEPDLLKRLIDLHMRERPGDVLIDYFTGELHLLRGEYDRAEAAYLAGMRKTTDEPTREDFVTAAVYNRWAAGLGVSAYGWLESKDDTFVQLAGLMELEGQGDQLAELLSLRRADVPDDPDLPWYDAAAAYFQKQYPQAERLLLAHREAFTADESLLLTFESRLITALVRQGKFEHALVEAQVSTDRDGDPYFLAYVEVMRGNADAATKHIEACLDLEIYDLWSFYNDADMGPVLRDDDDFAAFRAQYPEPRELTALREAVAEQADSQSEQ